MYIKKINDYGNWLNSLPWTHYATLTSRDPLTLKSARKAMVKFYDNLESQSNLNTSVFWVAEPFDTNFGYHIHALIKLDEKVAKRGSSIINTSWQRAINIPLKSSYSNTKIESYQPDLGAHYYVVKNIHWNNADYDLFVPSQKSNSDIL